MLLLLLLPAFPKHTFYKKYLLKFCKFHDETKMLNVRTNLRTQSSFATNNKNVFSKTMCYAALERFPHTYSNAERQQARRRVPEAVAGNNLPDKKK